MSLACSLYLRQTNILQRCVRRAFLEHKCFHIRPIITLPCRSEEVWTCDRHRDVVLGLKLSDSYCVSNLYLTSSAGSSCLCRLPANAILLGNSQYGRWHKKKHDHHHDYRFGPGTILAMGTLSFLFKRKEEEDTIEITIAKALLQERRGHVHEAEKLLHQALDKAFMEKNDQAVTYIYDQMANMLLRQEKLEQAEVSFKETLRRLLSSGTEKNDPAIIEISLKLAQIYSATKRVSEAQHGFQWCIDTTEARIKATGSSSAIDVEEEKDLKALLGMCLEGYARFFLRYKKYDDAEKLYLRALSICEGDLMANGQPHHESVTILNDLGTLYDLKGQYDKAKEYIVKSAKLAQKLGNQESLPTILCNLASVEAHLDNNKEAKRLFRKALKEAERQEDARSILIIKNKLAQLETDILLQKK